jgi:hypothetical protein
LEFDGSTTGYKVFGQTKIDPQCMTIEILITHKLHAENPRKWTELSTFQQYSSSKLKI